MRRAVALTPALLALPDGDPLVAGHDHPRGPEDILLGRTTAAGPGRAPRLDHSSCPGEDERDGPPQVYAATAGARRLR